MKSKINIPTGIRADRFEAIQYEKTTGPKGSSVGKRLGCAWVFRHIFQATWDRICNSSATADWSKHQTAKSLYDDPNWCSLGFGHRIAIGRCLRHFVNNGMLPLQVINPQSTGTKYYSPIHR